MTGLLKTKTTVMQESYPVLLSKNQAKTLLDFTDGNRPVLSRIWFKDGWGYWTNRFMILRFDLRHTELENGSFINLGNDDASIPNQKFDVLKNLRGWYRVAKAYSSFDLADVDRWNKPDDSKNDYPDLTSLLTVAEPDAEGVGVMIFNPAYINAVSTLVNIPGFNQTLRMVPSGRPNNVWFTGENERVQGMVVQLRGDKPEIYRGDRFAEALGIKEVTE